MSRIRDQMVKLADVVVDGGPTDDALEQAADAANFMAMLVDNYTRRKEKR